MLQHGTNHNSRHIRKISLPRLNSRIRTAESRPMAPRSETQNPGLWPRAAKRRIPAYSPAQQNAESRPMAAHTKRRIPASGPGLCNKKLKWGGAVSKRRRHPIFSQTPSTISHELTKERLFESKARD